MRSAMISAAFVAGAVATHPANGTEPSYTTKVVTAFTTYCPEPTQISHDGTVMTITSATTVVLPCPSSCTVTYPVISVPVVPTTPQGPAETHPAPPAETHPAPPAETHPAPPAETHPAPPAETHPAPPAETHPAPPAETHPAPGPTGSSGPVSPPVSPPIYGNSTVPATVPAGPTNPSVSTATGAASGTGAPGQGPVTPFEGAAPKMAASGASLVGLLGLAAFFL
ncbi:MAG: hypothetical protein Q9221_002489 [Calogaya cf. arnoldii]